MASILLIARPSNTTGARPASGDLEGWLPVQSSDLRDVELDLLILGSGHGLAASVGAALYRDHEQPPWLKIHRNRPPPRVDVVVAVGPQLTQWRDDLRSHAVGGATVVIIDQADDPDGLIPRKSATVNLPGTPTMDCGRRFEHLCQTPPAWRSERLKSSTDAHIPFIRVLYHPHHQDHFAAGYRVLGAGSVMWIGDSHDPETWSDWTREAVKTMLSKRFAEVKNR